MTYLALLGGRATFVGGAGGAEAARGFMVGADALLAPYIFKPNQPSIKMPIVIANDPKVIIFWRFGSSWAVVATMAIPPATKRRPMAAAVYIFILSFGFIMSKALP
jgi:hypothetical protein